jgi:hypothetical protein
LELEVEGGPGSNHFLKEAILNRIVPTALLMLILTAPVIAQQKLVDPAAVAPEYREAAEKRRAEQIKQQECARKAGVEKVIPRDRTAFLLHCLEATDAGPK